MPGTELSVSFFHSYNKSLLSIYYVPGIVLGTGERAVNKINEDLVLVELMF